MTDAELKAIEARANAASPGKWRWVVNPKSREIRLEGGTTVMDFVRWGMGSATPRFETAGLMSPAMNFTEAIVGREHHADWARALCHRDAEFIAHARADVPVLAAEVRRLRGLVATDEWGTDPHYWECSHCGATGRRQGTSSTKPTHEADCPAFSAPGVVR